MNYVQGHFYHIYNRGWNRGRIFFYEGNYIYLLEKMKNTFEQYGIDIIAYCLMPNHYHFLVRQDSKISISKWLQKIFVGYTQAVNIQQNRTGTLFQGRPKKIPITNEAYLTHLIWYIHTNPVFAGLVNNPEDWTYSNYLDCIGKRDGKMCDLDFISERFGSPKEYIDFIESYDPRDTKEKNGE